MLDLHRYPMLASISYGYATIKCAICLLAYILISNTLLSASKHQYSFSLGLQWLLQLWALVCVCEPSTHLAVQTIWDSLPGKNTLIHCCGILLSCAVNLNANLIFSHIDLIILHWIAHNHQPLLSLHPNHLRLFDIFHLLYLSAFLSVGLPLLTFGWLLSTHQIQLLSIK